MNDELRVHIKEDSMGGYLAFALDATHLVGYGQSCEKALEDLDRLIAMHRHLQEVARLRRTIEPKL